MTPLLMKTRKSVKNDWNSSITTATTTNQSIFYLIKTTKETETLYSERILLTRDEGENFGENQTEISESRRNLWEETEVPLPKD